MGATKRATVRVIRWRSPWGEIPVSVHNGRIVAIALDPRTASPSLIPTGQRPTGPIRSSADVSRLMRRVTRGIATSREMIAACELSSFTDFERRVFAALARVRRGNVVSYGELAAAAGSPRAARAVGTALGKNPTPILLPCHRVVAATGIGGYGGSAGQGWRPAGQDPIAFKRALLASEGALIR